MLLRLLLLFTVVPLVELALLLWIGEHTGWEFTLALVVVTGVVGASLARREGLRCWLEVQRRMAQGELPTDSLLEGLMILVAGAVLVTPGVLTDIFGFLLLVSPVRRLMRRWLARRLKASISVGPIPGAPQQPAGQDDDIIDVEHRAPDDRRN